MRRLLWVLSIVLLLLAVGRGACWLLESYLFPVPPEEPAARFELPAETEAAALKEQTKPTFHVKVEPVELLAPGTVIESAPPSGWTHLVIKSRPVISSGAVHKLSPECRGYGTFMFLATVARVLARKIQPPEPGLPERTTYALAGVAVGLGTAVHGKDTVLTPECKAEWGEDLDFTQKQAQRLILRGAYLEQRKVQVIARSATFALLDTPALLLRREDHRKVTLRYALLVEPATGQLDTLVWLIDRAENDPTPEPIEWLSNGHLEKRASAH